MSAALRGRAAARLLAALLLALLLGPAVATTAAAHEPGSTLILLSPKGGELELRMLLPPDRWDLAYGASLSSDLSASVQREAGNIGVRVADGVTLRSTDGTLWPLGVHHVGSTTFEDAPQIEVILRAAPPSGDPTEAFTLTDSVITEQILTHRVFVTRAVDGHPNELLGTISHYAPQLRIDTETATFGSMIGIGAGHLREGVDHLMFVALVALGAVVRRQGVRATVRAVAVLTGAFTVGHSISLIVATLGWVTLPARVVETGIAVTILVAALHVIRPVLPHRFEPAVTLVFGLIHGFGFAGTLTGMSVTGIRLLPPTLGFNLGLELAQLALLAVIALPVWLLGRSRHGTTVPAALIAVVAGGWILNRGLGLPDVFEGPAAMVAGTPERLAASLAVLAVALLLTTVPRPTAPAEPSPIITEGARSTTSR